LTPAAADDDVEVDTTSYIPVLYKRFQSGPGNLQGVVVDAITNLPLNGAVVCIQGDKCDITNEDGTYSISNIAYGPKFVDAERGGYLSLTQNTYVNAGSWIILNFALSPYLGDGEYRIVLTWGKKPKDLDAHFWLPFPNYPHLYLDSRGSCTGFPNVCLDLDDKDGNGPETISIKSLKENGTYRFAVLNYSYGYPGVPEITESSAKVQMYGKEGLIAQFDAPEEGIGDLWYVFDLDAATGEVSPVGCITFYPSDPDLPPECGAVLSADRVLYKK
jgi:adhesin/invasin